MPRSHPRYSARRTIPVLAWAACFALSISWASGATRVLPEFFEDTVPIRVFVETSPPPSANIQAVEEIVPDGWAVSDINYGGTFHATQSRIRWGPFSDNLPRTLAYRVTPPLDSPPTVDFDGVSIADQSVAPISGPRTLPKRPGVALRSLPARFLPGGRISIRIAVRPGASTLAWAIQESVPTGWQPSPVPPDASFDPFTRTLKWGPFLDPAARDLEYVLVSPNDTRSEATFSGWVTFESIAVPVTGSERLPIHGSSIDRVVPSAFGPRSMAEFALKTDPAPYIRTHTIEEDIPLGLIVGAVSHGGIWDATNRRVKWGPFADATPRSLTFAVSTPPAPENEYRFEGRGWFDDRATETIGGSVWVSANPTLPSTLSATIPELHDPLVPFLVRLASRPSSDVQVHAIEIPVPTGWGFVDASGAANFDAVQRRVKWGPFQDASPRDFETRLQPAREATGPVLLQAEGWYDASLVRASGNATTRPFPSTAERVLPVRFTPGTGFPVRIELRPSTTTGLVFVEESVPPDATVGEITEAGIYDPVQSKLKWGPFVGAVSRTLGYRLTPAPSARQSAFLSGTAVFDRDTVDISGSRLVPLNHAPDARPDMLPRAPAANAKIAALELLGNDGDVDGDNLRVRSVDTRSAMGGAVRLVGPWIFYDAPSPNPAEDQFSYTIEDAYGATAVAAATLLFETTSISSRFAIVAVIPQPGGKALVRFRAVPGTRCQVEVSRDLRNWVFLAEGTTGALGTGEVLDPDASAFPIRFYRASTR